MPDLQIPEEEHYREAIDSVRKRVPVPRDVWDTMQAEEREHAFTVSQVARIDVLQDVLDAMDKAVETGTALGDFRDEVADKLVEQWGGAEIPGRIETIFRTNIQVAYAEGRHAINSAPAVKDARPFWRYDDTDNDRECDTCHECHGVVLPADDPWWATHHPPLHHRCECTVTALSPEEAAEEGLTDPEEAPEVEVDEGFGNEPSSEGRDWAPDLTDLDPELRKALEAKLDEFKSRAPTERPEPQAKPEPHEREPQRAPEAHEPEAEPSEVERRIEKAIEEHESAHVDRKMESARVMSGAGEKVLDKKGNKSSVPLTRQEVEAMTNVDATFTHNHPNGSCLSWDDYKVAAICNVREMRAIARSPFDSVVRIHSFERPGTGWPEPARLLPTFERIDGQLRNEWIEKITQGVATEDEGNHGFWHALWNRVQSEVDVGYKCREVAPSRKGK